jgi:hypothetical protein
MVIRSMPVLAPPFDPNSLEARSLADAVGAGLGDDLTAQYNAALQSSLKVELNQTVWQRIAAGRM